MPSADIASTVGAAKAADRSSSVGVVVIGRNEGERLRRCLASVSGPGRVVVYVDSGSSDGSVALARAAGADVVELDPARPFTAARARNTGLERLQLLAPAAASVQFVDGDCEVDPRWLETARAFLDGRPDVAVVCGRRRERYPERSFYNRLCDIEWDTPVGEARACGGDALMRVAAFAQAGGFRAELIAGEEPELCLRLRGFGWKIWRLDAAMTLHDAAMTRFSQWWRRSERAGFAFAEGVRLHGAAPERHWVREARSAQVWAVGIPLAVACGVLAFGVLAATMLFIYPLQVARLSMKGHAPIRQRVGRALFLVIGKFPEALGQARFHWQRARGRQARLIEYK